METDNLGEVYLNRDDLIRLDWCSFLEYVIGCNCNELSMEQWVDYNCITDSQLRAFYEEVDSFIIAVENEPKENECVGGLYHLLYLILKRSPSLKADIKELEKQNTKPTPEPTQEPPPKPPHFTRSFTTDEQIILFDGLSGGGFLPKDTNKKHFNYVFGGTETSDFEPLKWQGTQSLLAYFIYYGFGDTDGTNFWKITNKTFTIKGKEPNDRSMATDVSKWNDKTDDASTKDKPKGHEND